MKSLEEKLVALSQKVDLFMSTLGVSIHWTGILDWTTGLTFESNLILMF